jgi:exodeoxyribonuclease VII large subunit
LKDKQVFTLKQVIDSIRKTIDERYTTLYWVKAEMHKLNLYPSGHCFPELVYKVDDKIVAQINGSIWKHNYLRINQKFNAIVKEPIKEGSLLLLQVKINFHETFGLSLQILDIDPSFTLGELQRERQETLLRLKKLGVLEQNQLLSFPILPKRVAVISAETSKGLSDFNQILFQNQWGYQFFTMLFPAYLQGDQAALSIKKQLDRILKVKRFFDLVVIVRGGGGEVGMSCYNNFELCHAIATFPLPIMTGIGHSTNFTVAEMVAYKNAITPTELADFLLQAFQSYERPLNEGVSILKNQSLRLIQQTNSALSSELRHFKNVSNQQMSQLKFEIKDIHMRFNSSSKLFIQKKSMEVRDTSQSISQATKTLLGNSNNSIRNQTKLLFSEANYLLKDQRRNINQINLKNPLTYIIEKETKQIENLEQVVRLMDPKHTLERGYSIVTFKGSLLSEHNLPKKDDEIIIEYKAGKLIAKFIKKEDNEGRN